MIDKTRVLDLFVLFTHLSLNEAEKWGWICENAISQISSNLKGGVSVSENMERLCTAASALAYADYMVISGDLSSGAEEIVLGDMKIKNSTSQGNTAANSERIKEYFLSQIGDLLVASPALIVPIMHKGDTRGYFG